MSWAVSSEQTMDNKSMFYFLIAMASNQTAMVPNLLAMASNLIAMASNQECLRTLQPPRVFLRLHGRCLGRWSETNHSRESCCLDLGLCPLFPNHVHFISSVWFSYCFQKQQFGNKKLWPIRRDSRINSGSLDQVEGWLCKAKELA